LKNRFEGIPPAHYAKRAVIARQAGEQMLARLEWMTLKPTRIIDLGCSAGYCTQLLQQRYPAAELFAVDDSLTMLAYAKTLCNGPVNWICSFLDRALPVKEHSVDLLVVNLLLPWCKANLEELLGEWRRVLRPEGLLMFSSLGPDTLNELPGQASAGLHFTDMHDLGDALVHVGFADPVLDVEHITLTYREQQQLQYELQVTGFVTKQQVIMPLEKNKEGVFPLTYEIIYGHAWESGAVGLAADGVVKIPLAYLRGRKSF
jgi:malonyl-CoA O-methyltransferase